MELDFGFGGGNSGSSASPANANADGSAPTGGGGNTPVSVTADDVTDLGDVNPQGNPAGDGGNVDDLIKPTADTGGDDDGNEGNDDGDSSPELTEGATIEVGEDTYTVDASGNLLDKDGNVFKEAKDVKAWVASFDTIDDAGDDQSISIANIQQAIGIEITDDDDNPIEFENTPEGIRSYIESVNEIRRDEHYEAAINTLYQKYPIINDVLNYYLTNGNSLEGFNEVPDRSSIVIDDSNEAQQEAIIRTAWEEQGRKGDVDGYIQYLKSNGTLLSTSKEELEGLQDNDRQVREEMEQEAQRVEEDNIKKLQTYWSGVHETIKSRTFGGYQIPETIVINRDGKKLSATPEDFFNYVYRVDKDGKSAYERDLAKETRESRRDDELLRAYLKFAGGDYSNLVNMAINKDKVGKLRLKAKERNTSTIRINKPKANTAKGVNTDLGYN